MTSMCQGSHHGENGLIIYMLDLEDNLDLREMGKGQGYSGDDHQDKQRLRVRNVLCGFKNTQEDSMSENSEQSPCWSFPEPKQQSHLSHGRSTVHRSSESD